MNYSTLLTSFTDCGLSRFSRGSCTIKWVKSERQVVEMAKGCSEEKRQGTKHFQRSNPRCSHCKMNENMVWTDSQDHGEDEILHTSKTMLFHKTTRFISKILTLFRVPPQLFQLFPWGERGGDALFSGSHPNYFIWIMQANLHKILFLADKQQKTN